MSPRPRPGRVRPLLSAVVLRTQSDLRLARLAGDGHQAAFAVIFERYERELRTHAGRVVRPSSVDDVLQHAMLSAWSSLLEGAQIDQLRPWLHRIVHNTALNATTRRGYDDDELPRTAASASLIDDLVQGRLAAGEALTAIAALPAAQRQALMLTAIDGRSARDAAADMGLSENALRQLVYRARTSMRSAASAVTPLPLLLAATGHAAAGPATVAGTGMLGGGGIAAATIGGSAAAKTAAVLAIAIGAVGTTAALHQDRRPHHTQDARIPSRSTPPPPRPPAPVAATVRHRTTPRPHPTMPISRRNTVPTKADRRPSAARQPHKDLPGTRRDELTHPSPEAIAHESTPADPQTSSDANQPADISTDPTPDTATDASSPHTPSPDRAQQETDATAQDTTGPP